MILAKKEEKFRLYWTLPRSHLKINETKIKLAKSDKMAWSLLFIRKFKFCSGFCIQISFTTTIKQDKDILAIVIEQILLKEKYKECFGTQQLKLNFLSFIYDRKKSFCDFIWVFFMEFKMNSTIYIWICHKNSYMMDIVLNHRPNQIKEWQMKYVHKFNLWILDKI